MGKPKNATWRVERPPAASGSQAEAVERCARGVGTPSDLVKVELLCDECGRYGCVHTVPGNAARRMPACPGWCDAAQAQRRADAARRAAWASGEAKPRPLLKPEVEALKAVEAGEAPSPADVLALERLAHECDAEGCARRGESPLPCPGWCGMRDRVWEMWWSS